MTMNTILPWVTLVVVIANFAFLVFITFHIRRIHSSEENRHKVMENSILTLADEVFKKLEYMNRWQKVLAKMINDDRSRLQDHDTKVEDMYRIAREVADKFLKEEHP